jgi:hypothetical protein
VLKEEKGLYPPLLYEETCHRNAFRIKNNILDGFSFSNAIIYRFQIPEQYSALGLKKKKKP